MRIIPRQSIPEEEIRKIARSLNSRDRAVTHEVEQRLVHLIHGVWRRHRLTVSGRNREQQLSYIEKLRRHLDHLKYQLDTADPLINRTLGTALAEPLTNLLGCDGVTYIYPEIAIVPDPRDGDRPRREQESYAANYLVRQERLIDENCAEVLLRLLAVIESPLTEILEIERNNTGGGRRAPYRDFIIKQAAPIFEYATGTRPPRSSEGRFVNFCTDLIVMLELPTVGLDSAIPRAL